MIEISERLKAKLADVKSDNEACAVLAADGIDLEEMERELGVEELERVSGGWDSIDASYACPFCGESNGDNISHQFFASLFVDSGSKYRCCTCGQYFYIINGGVRRYN